MACVPRETLRFTKSTRFTWNAESTQLSRFTWNAETLGEELPVRLGFT